MAVPAEDSPQPLRILTVSHFFSAHGGGIERVAGNLCDRLLAAGDAPSWAASGDGTALPAGGARGGVRAVALACIDPLEKILGLPMPIPGPAALRALRSAVRQSDGVIIHDALYLTSIAAMLAARRANKPVVLIQHIADIPFASAVMRGLIALANRMVTRPMLRAADHVVYISDTTRRAFAAATTRRAPALLFNGVDQTIFHPEAAASAAAPALHSPAGSSQRILFVGRFVEKKGLAVIEQLARQRPDVAFTLVGQGPIDPLGWGLGNVRVIGPLQQQQIAALYCVADALLLPSVGEGYPLVIQEAMACGLPVICGSESAIADPHAPPWRCGVPIDLANAPTTAAACSATMDDLAARQLDRQAMSRWARERYSGDAMAAAIRKMLAG